MLHAHNNATDPPEGNDMIERVAKLEERVDSALPHLSTKAEYEGARKDLHKGHSEMKSWTIATSFMIVAAVFTVGGFLFSYIGAIAKSVQNAPSQQTAPSQPAAPIIIYLPPPQVGAADSSSTGGST